MSQVLL